MKIISFIPLVVLLSSSVFAESFVFDESKRMAEAELKNKKEGNYATGLPQFGSDPVNGQGIGADLFLFNNGKKDDPYFQFTPYRSQTAIHAYLTNKAQKEIIIGMDVPYIFDTSWRFRLEAGYEDNPNSLYFGKTANTLNKLQHNGQTFTHYNDYQNSLEQTRSGAAGEAAIVSDEFYNTYRIQESIINLSLENAYLGGTFRVLGGFEMALVNITTFDGKSLNGDTQGTSLLQQENKQGLVRGLGNNLINIAQVGFIYDTRDFEPDPSSGMFVELTDELSNKAFGSRFNFNKTFFHANYYKQVAKDSIDRLILVGRYGISSTQGDAPFYEYKDSWSSEGSIEGLGGGKTLRGFKQSRFLAPLVSFINMEARWRFAETKVWNQHLSFNLAPFVDLGKVWDNIGDYNFNNYKVSQGLGLRIPWNQSTIVSLDYATSVEDKQFFLNFGHIF